MKKIIVQKAYHIFYPPIPPDSDMAMAISDSVTVSMGDDLHNIQQLIVSITTNLNRYIKQLFIMLHEGTVESDISRQLGVKSDFVRDEVDVSGEDDEVVVRQPLLVAEHVGAGNPINEVTTTVATGGRIITSFRLSVHFTGTVHPCSVRNFEGLVM